MVCNRTLWSLLSTLLLLLPIALQQENGCTFPPDWQGVWHHLGYDTPINVSNNNIWIQGDGSTVCVRRLLYGQEEQNTFGRFILQEERSDCLKCMIIYRKHFNVLQYKQSDCEEKSDIMDRGVKDIGSICDEIPGDAVMSSMFRVNGQSVTCPLQGPYSVGYSKGGAPGLCTYPPSMMDTCADKSMIQFQYQACPDHKGSESSVEQIVCMATWKEGHKNYLVGKLNHSHSHRLSERDKYQCFLYEGRPANIQMSQGQFHGSCQGLWSVNEGRRIFTLTKLSRKESCSLPRYFSLRTAWRSLENTMIVEIGTYRTSFSIERQGRLHHLTCYSHIKREHGGGARDNHMEKIIAHVKTGCESGYVCVEIIKRDDNILQLSTGQWSRHPDEACHSLYYNPQTRQKNTLVAIDHTIVCPFTGRYKVESERQGWNGGECSTYMQAGCSHSHTLQIQNQCDTGGTSGSMENNQVQIVHCHGLWEDNGSIKLVVSSQNKRLHCLDYVDNDGVAVGSFTQGSCLRESNLNLTSTGPCTLALTGQANAFCPSTLLYFVFVLFPYLTGN